MSDKRAEARDCASRTQNATLAEIIEKQKQFDARHIQPSVRNNDKSIASATTKNEDNRRQVKQQCKESDNSRKQRRKFSLSFQISGFSVGSGSSSTATQPSHGSGQVCSKVEQQLVEAKDSRYRRRQGFISKAIRRGSKIFDSMVQFSTSISGDSKPSKYPQVRRRVSVEAESDAASIDKREPAKKGERVEPDCQSTKLVQFERKDSRDERPDSPHNDEDGGGGAKSRKGRLRLGSIPHDIRRALSLGGASNSSSPSPQLPAKQQSNELVPRHPLQLRRKSSLFSALAVSPTPSDAPFGNQSASFSICQDHSRTYKVIVFGSSAVGKTALIQRLFYGRFPAVHTPTVEELHSNKYTVPELGEIYLEVLDTSGTFEFPAMRRLSVEKGDAFILVYSVLDESSWREVVALRKLICDEKAEQRRRADSAARTKRRPPPPTPNVGRRTSSTPALKSELLQRRLSVHHLLENSAPIALGTVAPSVLAKCRRQSSLDKLNEARCSQRFASRSQDANDDYFDNDNDSGGDEAHLLDTSSSTPIVVVANKSDVERSQFRVDQDAAAQSVRQWGHSFVECSAKEAQNVDQVLRELLVQARAPDLLSQVVIDDHRRRRKSLPNIRSQLARAKKEGLNDSARESGCGGGDDDGAHCSVT